jgi:hypothetical protein
MGMVRLEKRTVSYRIMQWFMLTTNKEVDPRLMGVFDYPLKDCKSRPKLRDTSQPGPMGCRDRLQAGGDFSVRLEPVHQPLLYKAVTVYPASSIASIIAWSLT